MGWQVSFSKNCSKRDESAPQAQTYIALKIQTIDPTENCCCCHPVKTPQTLEGCVIND